MDIMQMRCYMQLYEDRSFTKAASRMFISQQGLSRIIKSMEDEYQVSFFHRTSEEWSRRRKEILCMKAAEEL
ncbi:MAG TPA: LysR family transcriptional regulator [Lachnospiraceae bacterium]|nr:LysR family transcriptional regulator [Lachnospiraceae bacterium]